LNSWREVLLSRDYRDLSLSDFSTRSFSGSIEPGAKYTSGPKFSFVSLINTSISNWAATPSSYIHRESVRSNIYAASVCFCHPTCASTIQPTHFKGFSSPNHRRKEAQCENKYLSTCTIAPSPVLFPRIATLPWLVNLSRRSPAAAILRCSSKYRLLRSCYATNPSNRSELSGSEEHIVYLFACQVSSMNVSSPFFRLLVWPLPF